MQLIEIHLESENLERALTFYKRLLPYKRLIRSDDGGQVFLVLPGGAAVGIWRKDHVGLFDGRAGSHVHFAIQVGGDCLERMKTTLQGLETPYSEHTWPDGHRSVYFVDPDGHQGEFITKNWLGEPGGEPF